MSPDFSHETPLWEEGNRLVVGVDECGRGPLAGNVTACAAWFAPGTCAGDLAWVTDSKKLTEARVVEAAQRLREMPPSQFRFGLGTATPEEIDRINIRRATVLAWERAVRALLSSFSEGDAVYVLLDGPADAEFSFPHTGLIKGDSRSLLIAAASIVGKAHRDAVMRELAGQHPQFSCWARDKGYGSKTHIRALKTHGPVAGVHRMSYGPVAQTSLF